MWRIPVPRDLSVVAQNAENWIFLITRELQTPLDFAICLYVM